jgi:hypothetical protein
MVHTVKTAASTIASSGGAHAAPDSELDAVAEELLDLDPSGTRTGRAIRRSFDMLLDGQHTGRFRWEQLSKTEKTHCGTLVEINLQREFAFADGTAMDFAIRGIDVDCKYSQDLHDWMIPREAVGHLCLGLWASDHKGIWSAGLFRAAGDILRSPKGNQDKKRQLSAAGRSSIRWLHWQKPLPGNVLLGLAEADIAAIFAPRAGAKRIDELFRRAIGLRVSRNVIATVAMQEDYMKRVRGNGGARSSLRPDGIVIFGQFKAHGAIAAALGLPVPSKGEHLSARLAPLGPHHDGMPAAEIGGSMWVAALPGDPVHPAPALPLPRGHAG